MKEIADKTGLSLGAFYHHFKSKEQLFLEIADYYFKELMRDDFSQFSQESLWQFLNDYIANLLGKMEISIYEGKENEVNSYMLIFDALKILPIFKERILAHKEKELEIWMKILKAAKTKGEIKPKMSDGQIARFFMYSREGLGIRLLMEGNIASMGEEMRNLWMEYYAQIKG